MARYAIGDIQGCYKELMTLLDQIEFNPGVDTLYLVGDLVNRGLESLKVLKWAYKNQDRIITVLGNHDIYLLARYNNLLAPDVDETIQDILTYKDARKLIDWLRSSELIFHDSDYILVHAGIYPKMDFNRLLSLNHMISNHLQSPAYAAFLYKIYGNKPNLWSEELDLIKQMKFVVNACTRMRYLNTLDYSLDYKYKGEVFNCPSDLTPWFKVDCDLSINKKILFGHWAALGYYQDDKVISLDTGCVWGRKLTAVNLDDYTIYQVEA